MFCLFQIEKKVKKPRVNQVHRWSESETKELVEAVVDEIKGVAELFEVTLLTNK